MIAPGDILSQTPLNNGLMVTIRAIRPDDKARLKAAFEKLDSNSVYTRFFGYKKELTDAELQTATSVDFNSTVALVATIGSGEREIIIAGARYVTDTGGKTAEIAFMVEEDYQGLGLASRLLKELSDIARDSGVMRFEAEVLSRNASMLKVFQKSSLPVRTNSSGGVVHVTIDLGPPAESRLEGC